MKNRVSTSQMLRRLPNALTASRIPAGLILFALPPLSPWFLIVYAYCGLSDVLDGYLARRMGCAGARGARLDSVADLVFTAAEVAMCVRALPLTPWMLYWTGAIAAVRVGAWIVGWIKYRAFPLRHTVLNKITGALLFLLPFNYLCFGMSAAALAACLPASLAAAEELALTLRRDTLERDARGLLWKN